MKWIFFKLAFVYPRVYAMFCYYRKKERRKEIEEKFSFFFKQKLNSKQKKAIVRHIFELRGLRKVGYYFIPLLDAQFIKRFVKVEGLHYLDQALQEGRNVVLMAGHFGNPHLGFYTLKAMGYDIIGIRGRAPRPTRKSWHQKFRHFDTSEDAIFIDAPFRFSELRRISETFRSGKIILYYGDTKEGKKKEKIPFLGREIGFPTGIIHLAHQAKAAVIPHIHLYHKGKISLIFKKPIDNDWEKRESGDRRVVEDFVKILESYFLAQPQQYMGIYGPTVLSDYYLSYRKGNTSFSHESEK